MKRTNLKKKRVIALITISLLIGGGTFRKLLIGANSPRDITEFTIAAEEGTLPGVITANGELQAEKTVNISPIRQGLLEKIYVQEGDTVSKGQLIAKMDYGDLIYRLNELNADFRTQRASYERRKILFKEGAISKEQLEEYKNMFLKSQARLNQLNVQKDDLEIRSPFQGTITSRYAVPGAFVTPTTSRSISSQGGTTSSSIVELSQGIEIIAKVPESDIGRIKVDEKAILRVDAFPDERFKATVKKISPRATKNNNVTSFEVALSINETPKKLRIGMTADIEFQTEPTNISTLIPTVAIVTKLGEPGVLLIGEGNQPKFKKVELGISSGSKTSIISGIKPGELIFINLPPWAKQKKD